MAADSEGKRATYDDLLEVPEHLVAEIIEGTLRTQPRPASPHAHAASVLGMTSARRSKLPIYARAGVSHLWLVDPTARSVEVLGSPSTEFFPLGKFRPNLSSQLYKTSRSGSFAC